MAIQTQLEKCSERTAQKSPSPVRSSRSNRGAPRTSWMADGGWRMATETKECFGDLEADLFHVQLFFEKNSY
eukprot:CAMPEP_0116839110 /NCGR_PEP_ID=MMETSP0418-20121206/9585_1 /TAXON_ID=1158023 /ORGANISM="Astrosyne radiata, Strain 13vi08-1A" /LENGTH=71 /DNA_ID=CAMNT_0004469185 /DNA_START=146 /DNA_END=361 /DNA_ORIENTATION=+